MYLNAHPWHGIMYDITRIHGMALCMTFRASMAWQYVLINIKERASMEWHYVLTRYKRTRIHGMALCINYVLTRSMYAKINRNTCNESVIPWPRPWPLFQSCRGSGRYFSHAWPWSWPLFQPVGSLGCTVDVSPSAAINYVLEATYVVQLRYLVLGLGLGLRVRLGLGSLGLL